MKVYWELYIEGVSGSPAVLHRNTNRNTLRSNVMEKQLERKLEIQLSTQLEMYIGSCRRCQRLPSSASSQPRSSGYDSAAFRYPPTSIPHHHGYDDGLAITSAALAARFSSSSSPLLSASIRSLLSRTLEKKEASCMSSLRSS